MKTTFFTAKRKRSLKLFALGFVPFAGFLLLYALPMALSAYFSLLDSSFHRVFVGLENYADIWQNRYFLLGCGIWRRPAPPRWPVPLRWRWRSRG